MITIRAATDNDIPRILELYRQLDINASKGDLDDNPINIEWQSAFAQIKAMPGHELLVAEEDGEVVGTTVLLIIPNLSHNASPWAEVENVVVDRKHRRQGIGKQLMEYAVARARQAGCHKIQLSSNKKRRGAHSFYGELGFSASAQGFRLYF